MLKNIAVCFLIFNASMAFGEIFSIKIDKLSARTQFSQCNEIVTSLVDKLKDRVEILAYGCEENSRYRDLLDAYIEYEAESKLVFFDSDRDAGLARIGYFSSWEECSKDMMVAAEKFEILTGAPIDLAYCMDDGLFQDKTPYRFRLLSTEKVETETVWFKQYVFGQLVNFSKQSFRDYLSSNLQSYGLDLFTLGFRSSMVWGEILFGAFSKDTLRIKSWNELNYDGVETCLLNTQKIEQMFSQQRHGPAAIFCTREQFGEFKLNIWGLVDKSHKKEVFRIRPMQRVFGSVSDCETSTVELSSDTLGQFCAKDRDKRLRKHLVLKVKGIE